MYFKCSHKSETVYRRNWGYAKNKRPYHKNKVRRCRCQISYRKKQSSTRTRRMFCPVVDCGYPIRQSRGLWKHLKETHCVREENIIAIEKENEERLNELKKKATEEEEREAKEEEARKAKEEEEKKAKEEGEEKTKEKEEKKAKEEGEEKTKEKANKGKKGKNKTKEEKKKAKEEEEKKTKEKENKDKKRKNKTKEEKKKGKEEMQVGNKQEQNETKKEIKKNKEAGGYSKKGKKKVDIQKKGEDKIERVKIKAKFTLDIHPQKIPKKFKGKRKLYFLIQSPDNLRSRAKPPGDLRLELVW